MGHLAAPFSSAFCPRTMDLTNGRTGREPSYMHGKSIERRRISQEFMADHKLVLSGHLPVITALQSNAIL